MPSVPLKFSGRIIEELSQNIPSTLFALNELIKNAYDAFSSEVKIKIDPNKKTIIISDLGNGMEEAEIEALFHISRSSKKYGQVVEQNGVERIVQGSKGLGFLAALKFGDKVNWVTFKNGLKSSFSVTKSILSSTEDLTGLNIPISIEHIQSVGTTITIHASEQEINLLVEELSDRRVMEKLVSTMWDDSFNIEIEIESNNEKWSTKKLKSFTQEQEDKQLFYVKYNSETGRLEFYHKGILVRSHDFDLSRTDYAVSLELIVFFFGSGSKCLKSISPLNRRLKDDSLAPLIYVNRNLFNNNDIFDPDILRKVSSRKTLAQIVGRVNVVSSSSRVEFNSDRTNFVENELTKKLRQDLYSLNKLIQTIGSEIKDELKNSSLSNNPPLGRAVPCKDQEFRLQTASILINRQKPTSFFTPSEQVCLDDYIFKVRNSYGEEVDKGEVTVSIDGEESQSRILPSIEKPCEIKVSFNYKDKNTSLVSNEIDLLFQQKISNISGKPTERSIFTIPSNNGYVVTVELVADLIYAIDKAYKSASKDEYLPIIACSIRAIFEISIDKLIKERRGLLFATNKFDRSRLIDKAKNEFGNDLLWQIVAEILILLKKNQKLLTEVSKATGAEFSTWNNFLDLSSFKNAVKKSHIGAHKSARYLSKPTIETCAEHCGLFAVICDVLINLDANVIKGLNLDRVNESDLNAYL